MNDIEVSSIDLVEGGNVFKQGHYLTLGYVPRDEKGETVDLSGKTLNVSLWGRKGVVFEAAATYSGGVIRFTFDKLVAAGDYTVEFTATSSTDAKYRKKFPTNQHSGRIAIKQSADDLGVVGIQVYTVAQLKAEQKALLDAAVSGFTVDSETKMARVSGSTTYTSLPARLEADKQATALQLAEKVSKDELSNVLDGSPRGTFATLADLQTAYPTGAEGVFIVTADGHIYSWDGTAWVDRGLYQAVNISRNAIGHENTKFVRTGKNLFNKNSLSMIGYRLSPFTGLPEANAAYDISEYIPIEASAQYSRVRPEYITSFYDENFNYISFSHNTNPFTTPANAKYIRLSVAKITLDEEQLEKGSVKTKYEAFKLIINKFRLDDYLSFDAYPFQPFAFFNGKEDDIVHMKRAVKDIVLYGADKTKKYALGIVQRNFSTYGTGAYVYECNADGTTNKIVAMTSLTSYTIPSGVDKFELAEYQGSGVVGLLYIDWNEIPSGVQYTNTHYDKSGLDFKTFNNEIEIKLPPKIPAVVGKEVNVYFDNIILWENPSDYNVDVTCSIGKHQNERWTAIPTTTGTSVLIIQVYKDGHLVAKANADVIVSAVSKGTGVTRKGLFIGDSTTDAGTYTSELVKLFAADPMGLELLGSRGFAPNLHEGRSGWKASNYVNDATVGGVTNAFYNNGFDFTYYMTQQGYTGVDVVGIHLGINDIFSYIDDRGLYAEIPNIISRFNTMIASIKAYNTNTKVALLIAIPPSITQDSFGANYQNNQSKWRYRRNHFLFSKVFIDQFKGREAEGIHLVPINVNLDTANNMLTETVAINSRNPATIVRQANGVHPASIGYYQMADVIYYWLKGQEA